jgi:hypothetical protein
MKKLTLSILFWVVVFNLKGQVIEAVSLGTDLLRQAGEKMERKKKIKLAKRYTQFITTESGDVVPMMRVPNSEINSKAENFIIALQEQLKRVHNLYLEKKNIKNFEDLMTRINFIKNGDPDWVSDNYLQEIRFYEDYNKELEEKEKTERLNAQKIQRQYDDSIQHVQRLETLRLQEALRQRRDSISKVEELNRQAFYNAEKIRQDSLNIINRITELQEMKTTKTSNERNSIIYESKEEKTKTVRPYTSKGSTKTYYTGKRGGCYYLSASGSKVYVDRSLCN